MLNSASELDPSRASEVFSTPPKMPIPSHDVCFKIFVVATIILAAIVVVAGILALMATKGALPSSWEPLSKMKVVGELNSYFMIGGGISLLFLGLFAWNFQSKKERKLLYSPSGSL